MSELESVVKGLECCIDGPCDICDYNNHGPETCRDLLMFDAINLLKAQQPRVMTLEEVRAAEVVWIEQVGRCVCAIKLENFDSGTMSFAYEYNNYVSVVNIKPAYYGKISRCWTARPTDVQREAETWKS